MSNFKEVPKQQLGFNGPFVSAIGLGTMGELWTNRLSSQLMVGFSGFGAFYGPPNGNAQKVLTCAADLGMTFWGCADIYGACK